MISGITLIPSIERNGTKRFLRNRAMKVLIPYFFLECIRRLLSKYSIRMVSSLRNYFPCNN